VQDLIVEQSKLEINAFRIVPEVGNSFFLDFIHYYPATKRGVVVERLRMHREGLEAVRSRLANDVVEIGGSDISVIWSPVYSDSMVN